LETRSQDHDSVRFLQTNAGRVHKNREVAATNCCFIRKAVTFKHTKREVVFCIVELRSMSNKTVVRTVFYVTIIRFSFEFDNMHHTGEMRNE